MFLPSFYSTMNKRPLLFVYIVDDERLSSSYYMHNIMLIRYIAYDGGFALS